MTTKEARLRVVLDRHKKLTRFNRWVHPWMLAWVVFPLVFVWALLVPSTVFALSCLAFVVFMAVSDLWWTSPYMRAGDLHLASMRAIGATHTLREGLSHRAFRELRRRREVRERRPRPPTMGPFR